MNEKMYFYYQRDKENRPLVTVCLIEGPHGIGKGIAICSTDDIPEKKVGKEYAKRRALKAYWGRRTDEPIKQRKAHNVIEKLKSKSGVWLGPKIWYNPVLSEHEENIIKRSNQLVS